MSSTDYELKTKCKIVIFLDIELKRSIYHEEITNSFWADTDPQ